MKTQNPLLRFGGKHPIWTFFIVSFLTSLLLLFTGDYHPRWSLLVGLLTATCLYVFGKMGTSTTYSPKDNSTDAILTKLKWSTIPSAELQILYARDNADVAGEIVRFLLSRPEVRASIIMGYDQNSVRRWGKGLFAFILPEELLSRLGLRPSELCFETERRLMKEAITILLEANETKTDATREEPDVVRVTAGVTLSFEVIVKDDLSSETLYWFSKTLMSGSAPITHLFVDARGRDRGIFRFWDEPVATGGGPSYDRGVMVRGEKLMTNEQIALIALPDRFGSKTTDIAVNDDIEAICQVDVGALGGTSDYSRTLREQFGIRSTRFNPPRPLDGLRRIGRKGSIRAVGVVSARQAQPYREDQFRQALLTTTIMVFGTEPAEVPDATPDRDITGLLDNLFAANPNLTRIVHSAGNFIIEYRPIAEGSTWGQYNIMPIQGTTQYFRRQPHHKPDAWQDADNYKDIPPGKFTKIPSECFIRTYSGNGQEWICLQVDIGSPGVNEASFGNEFNIGAIDGTADLKATLELFVLHEKITHYRLSPKTAQGLLAQGTSPKGRNVYLKLLDPVHVQTHRTDDLFEQLQRAGFIPPAVEGVHVDGAGIRSPKGTVLIFVTPNYTTVADVVTTADYGTVKSRLKLCHRMVKFASQLLKIGIVCPDWDLNETGIVGPEDGPDWDGRLFIVDYGSYMHSQALGRTSHNRKPECEGPENWDESLPFHAEPYAVFGLGLLCYQVLAQTPGLLPEALALRNSIKYEQELVDEITPALRLYNAESAAGVIIKMLVWDPEYRPRFPQLVAMFEELVSRL